MALYPSRRSLAMAPLFAAFAAHSARGDAPPRFDPSVPPPQATANVVPPAQIDGAVARLDGLATDTLRQTKIPGLAIAVVLDGHTVYAAGFGVRRAGTTQTVDADTVFQLASLSKSLSATVVAHQVGRRVVRWDEPIVSLLPWFALNDDWVTRHVTIADMFAHRSGLPDHAGDELEDIGYDRREVLHRLRFARLHSFRDEYAYTNFGLTAAAEAVAAASHIDWATLSEQVFYQPLGMRATSSRFADFMQQSNRAVGHVRVGDTFEPRDQRQPDAQSPAGGASASVRDMARWMAMVLQGGTYQGAHIVDATALLPAVTAQIVASPSGAVDARAGCYGYGFGVGTLPSARVALSHSGAFSMGAATNYVMIPSLRLGIVVLSNAAPIGAVEALAMEFVDLVQFGVITRDWRDAYAKLVTPMLAPSGSLVGKAPPDHPAPALPLAAYAGTYANDYFGDAEVVQQGEGLILRLGPAPMAFALLHRDGNVFTYVPSNENASAGSISKVTFVPEAAGPVRSLAIEFYDDTGWATFTRR